MGDTYSNSDFDASVKPPVDRQILFDRFLTYRRRMARLVAVQALYLYDIYRKANLNQDSVDLFSSNIKKKTKDPMLICQEVVYFYRNMFFTPAEYGWNKKSKKVDESFVYEIVYYTMNNMDNVDQIIANNLNERWTINKLDAVLRNLLRCATTEVLLPHKVEKPILCSEYTNVAGNFFSGKEIGFVNGIIDSIYTKYRAVNAF